MNAAATHRSRRMYANSIFSVLSWFVPIILGFVATPLLVRGLGPESYGLYAIILGFLSYSFTFGIGRVASKFVAEYTASGKPETVSESILAVLGFSLIVGITGATILAVTTPYIVREILLLPSDLQAAAEMSLYIACITGVMAMVSQVFQNALQGLHKFGIYLLITNTGAVILSTGNIVLALSGYGVPALLLWNLFAVATTGTLFFVTAVSSLPNFVPTFSVSSEVLNGVLKYGGSIILYQIFANVFFIFERSWIVRIFGAESLTYYFVPMLLGIYMHGLITSFAQVLFPRLNELLADREALLALYLKANRIVVAAIVSIVSTLIASGEAFLSLWVGNDFGDRSYYVLVIHAVTFGLIALIVVVWNIAEAFRTPVLNILVTFVWMAAGTALMAVIGNSRGLEGIAAARLIATVLTLPVIYIVEKRFLGGFQLGYWLKLFGRVSVAASALVVVEIAILTVFPEVWPALILAWALGTVSFGIIIYLSGFFTEQELAMLQKFRRAEKNTEGDDRDGVL